MYNKDTKIKGRFKKNFLLIAKANIFAQALPFIATPLLSRLYMPSDFGALAIFSSILMLLSSVCVLRTDWSIPNTKSYKQAAALFWIGLMTLIIFCTVLFIMILNRHYFTALDQWEDKVKRNYFI